MLCLPCFPPSLSNACTALSKASVVTLGIAAGVLAIASRPLVNSVVQALKYYFQNYSAFCTGENRGFAQAPVSSAEEFGGCFCMSLPCAKVLDVRLHITGVRCQAIWIQSGNSSVMRRIYRRQSRLMLCPLGRGEGGDVQVLIGRSRRHSAPPWLCAFSRCAFAAEEVDDVSSSDS
jgi:hypothetical protein